MFHTYYILNCIGRKEQTKILSISLHLIHIFQTINVLTRRTHENIFIILFEFFKMSLRPYMSYPIWLAINQTHHSFFFIIINLINSFTNTHFLF